MSPRSSQTTTTPPIIRRLTTPNLRSYFRTSMQMATRPSCGWLTDGTCFDARLLKQVVRLHLPFAFRNANGPGGLDNMTNIWLPLVHNNASALPWGPGSPLAIQPCNSADPSQIFVINSANSTVTHAASGLCVVQTGGSQSQLVLSPCGSLPAAQETWVPSAGSTLANGQQGSNCLNWNNVNNGESVRDRRLPEARAAVTTPLSWTTQCCLTAIPLLRTRATSPPTGTSNGCCPNRTWLVLCRRRPSPVGLLGCAQP